MAVAARVREFFRQFAPERPCMERKWVVTALYCPAIRTVVKWDRYSSTREQVVPPNAGIEFKFTVANAQDEVEAVAAVMQSGFFLAELSKQFGFIAKEVA